MSGKYICRGCGTRFFVRELAKRNMTHCPACGELLPHKTLMRRNHIEKARKFQLNCLCGASYRITPPKGAFRFECPKCGRFLLSIRPRELNGVELPRFIEAVGGSK